MQRLTIASLELKNPCSPIPNPASDPMRSIPAVFPGEILVADRYYAQRWQVELDIRSLKTHMQMEALRCKSPAMARKEIYTHMISYNLIRDLVVRTALRHDTSPKNLSHTAAIQSLNAFSENLQASSNRIEQLEKALLESIIAHPVGDRKLRVHPRELKRSSYDAIKHFFLTRITS